MNLLGQLGIIRGIKVSNLGFIGGGIILLSLFVSSFAHLALALAQIHVSKVYIEGKIYRNRGA